MKYYIYSILDKDIIFKVKVKSFIFFNKTKEIRINGKISKEKNILITPKGAITKIDEKSFNILISIIQFNKYVNYGYLSYTCE